MRIQLWLLLVMPLAMHAEWKRVTSLPFDGAGPAPVATYVAPKSGWIYVSSFDKVYRAKADEVEATPEKAVWSDISDGLPKGGARQFQETSDGNIVAIFGFEGGGVTCRQCDVGWFDGSRWHRSSIGLGGAVNPVGLQIDRQGYIYVNTWKDCAVFRSKDGGKHFSGMNGGSLYVQAGQPNGGCYALNIYGSRAYWGGEGGIMESDLEFKNHRLLCCGPGGKYKRDVMWVLGNGDAAHDATELISMGRMDSYFPANMERWEKGGEWEPVSMKSGYLAWGEPNIFNQGGAKGLQPHEYFVCLGDKRGSNGGIFVTHDAGKTWAPFDRTGLPQSKGIESYPIRMAIDPRNGSLFQAWAGKSGPRALFVYQR